MRGSGRRTGHLGRGLGYELGHELADVVEARQPVLALSSVEHQVEVVHGPLLRPLTLVRQVDLTGVSGSPDGLPVEGQAEALRVVRAGADRPPHLTGNVVPADAVSMELTKDLFVLCEEGAGHRRLTPSRACGDE
ncbi:hypothetical protein OKW18_000077 [Streptomyces pratensis]|nr:hypothetical protein [Streptomyces pratensis]